jgi:hypothetical protein
MKNNKPSPSNNKQESQTKTQIIQELDIFKTEKTYCEDNFVDWVIVVKLHKAKTFLLA